METPPALEIHDLKKAYKAKKVRNNAGVEEEKLMEALKGVSLTIARGEFFAFLGPNGAGKTTLISIVAGLAVKTSGTVSICGVSIDKDPDRAKSFIGLVPQEFNFDWFQKVLDVLIMQAGYYGIRKQEALPRAEKLLRELGLWEKRNEQTRALSGGMKRRLMIARALMHEPQVLLLDEPTAGVDIEMRRSMWEFLRALNASGTTIVLTTHYLEEAEQLCREVAIIDNGQIIKQGSVKSLLTTLNFVTLTLDTVEPVTDAALHLLRDMKIKRIDEMTLELRLKPGETVNDALRRIGKVGIEIANIRNNGSRLEEVFLNLIEKN